MAVAERHMLGLGERLALAEEHVLGEAVLDRGAEFEGQEEVADGDSVPLGDFQEAVAECDRVPETVGVTEPVPLVVAVRHRLGLAVEQALVEVGLWEDLRYRLDEVATGLPLEQQQPLLG